MIVTLDGERLEGAFAANETLRTLIERIRQAHLSDRLVVSVAVDGQPLLDQQLGERLDSALDGVERVELASADRRQLATDALREVGKRLEGTGQQQAEIAELLQAGDTPKAMERFAGFLKAWQACHEVIVDCSRLLGQDLTAVEYAGQPVRAHAVELADRLRELRDAFEARDTVLLGDLIRYEMPEMCRTWGGIVDDLAAQIDAAVGEARTTAS